MSVIYDHVLGQLRTSDASGSAGASPIAKVNGAAAASLELAADIGSYYLELRRRSISLPLSCVQQPDAEQVWTLDIATGDNTPVSLGSMFDTTKSDALTPAKLNRCIVRWDGVNATLKVYDTLDNRALPLPDFLRFVVQRFQLPDYYPEEYVTVTLTRTSESAYGVPVFANDEGDRWECTGLDIKPGQWMFVSYRLSYKGRQFYGEYMGNVGQVDVFQPFDVMDFFFIDDEYEYVAMGGTWA